MTESLKQFLSFVVSVLSLLLFDETEANTAYEIRRSENLRSRSTIDPFRFVTGNNRALREWQSSLAIVADHGLPVEAFPLGLCQGNCNVDNVSLFALESLVLRSVKLLGLLCSDSY